MAAARNGVGFFYDLRTTLDCILIERDFRNRREVQTWSYCVSTLKLLFFRAFGHF